MGKSAKFLFSLLLVMVLILSGCMTRLLCPSHTVAKQQSLTSKQSEVARNHFEAGKQAYYNCDFMESIHELQKAIVYEPSNTRKAVYCIYMGANWFYMGERSTASLGFSQAKKYSREVRPSELEFPEEIVKFFNSAH